MLYTAVVENVNNQNRIKSFYCYEDDNANISDEEVKVSQKAYEEISPLVTKGLTFEISETGGDELISDMSKFVLIKQPNDEFYFSPYKDVNDRRIISGPTLANNDYTTRTEFPLSLFVIIDRDAYEDMMNNIDDVKNGGCITFSNEYYIVKDDLEYIDTESLKYPVVEDYKKRIIEKLRDYFTSVFKTVVERDVPNFVYYKAKLDAHGYFVDGSNSSKIEIYIKNSMDESLYEDFRKFMKYYNRVEKYNEVTEKIASQEDLINVYTNKPNIRRVYKKTITFIDESIKNF